MSSTHERFAAFCRKYNMAERLTPLPEGTYVVAVGSLCTSLVPTLVMALAFLGVGTHVALEAPDLVLSLLMALGIIAALARVFVLLRYRARASAEVLDIPQRASSSDCLQFPISASRLLSAHLARARSKSRALRRMCS